MLRGWWVALLLDCGVANSVGATCLLVIVCSLLWYIDWFGCWLLIVCCNVWLLLIVVIVGGY